jgi:hypothetical protein
MATFHFSWSQNVYLIVLSLLDMNIMKNNISKPNLINKQNKTKLPKKLNMLHSSN